MKREQIEILIKTHQGRLDRAIAILDQNYATFEENDDPASYDYWIGEFRKETQIVRWLNGQIADNE